VSSGPERTKRDATTDRCRRDRARLDGPRPHLVLPSRDRTLPRPRGTTCSATTSASHSAWASRVRRSSPTSGSTTVPDGPPCNSLQPRTFSPSSPRRRHPRVHGRRGRPLPRGSAHHLEVRVFAAPVGVREDPVTGSFNAGLAQWMIAAGTAPPSYTASQGACVGRRGVVHIDAREGASGSEAPVSPAFEDTSTCDQRSSPDTAPRGRSRPATNLQSASQPTLDTSRRPTVAATECPAAVPPARSPGMGSSSPAAAQRNAAVRREGELGPLVA
jgi:hypothetical protein